MLMYLTVRLCSHILFNTITKPARYKYALRIVHEAKRSCTRMYTT